MVNNDSLMIVSSANTPLRLMLSRTTSLVGSAAKMHDTWPVPTAAMGRALTAGVIMSHLLAEGERLTLQWDGGGPAGRIVVSVEPDNTVRGYVSNPHVDVPPKGNGKLDVGAAVGKDGKLMVIKGLPIGDPYIGSVPLVSGEIAEDLALYFARSEQVPSVVNLGVLVGTGNEVMASGGYILQALPGITEEALANLEDRAMGLPPISEMLNTMDDNAIISAIMEGFEPRILDSRKPCYKCSCSRERLERVLATLGENDIREMIDGPEPREVICDFCRSRYMFSPEELQGLLKEFNINESGA